MKRRRLLLLCAAVLGASGVAEGALPEGVKTGIKVDRFTMSGEEGTKWAAQSIAGAKKDVLAEVFGVSEKKVVKALDRQIGNKVPVRANTDPENIGSKSVQKLIGAGGDFRPWGGNALRKGEYDIRLNPRKVHAKAVHFDDKAWLSTASLQREHANSLDATAIVSGKSAAAARAITERAFRGDMRGMRDAAKAGRRQGVLLNDAAAKITHLSNAMDDIIRGAKSELVVSMKAIESPAFAAKLSDAAARGVNVTVLTHPSKMSPKAEAALSPNIRVLADPYGVLHANMIVADRKVGIFGSAHATGRALGEGSRRQSHEMGYVVEDKGVLAQMREAVLNYAHGE
jgi:hypothetical protein